MAPVRDARIEGRKGHSVAGTTQAEREVERRLQNAAMTHRDHRFILVPGNKARQGTAGTDQKRSPALAATGELVEGMGSRGQVRAGVTSLPLIDRQPIGLARPQLL